MAKFPPHLFVFSPIGAQPLAGHWGNMKDSHMRKDVGYCDGMVSGVLAEHRCGALVGMVLVVCVLGVLSLLSYLFQP